MQKQLGCMNGMFQLFDRHNFLPGRRATGHNHKRLSPGTGQDINPGTEQNGTTEKTLMQGKNSKQVWKEKLTAPVELSRTSFSSSCSSSTFSSADCNKTSQSEPSSSCKSSFPETTSLMALPMNQQSSSSHLSQQSLDIRDIVKGSMCRESRGLSVKTTVKEEGGEHAIKHIDSPRPLHQHKSVQPKVKHDGSLHVLAKLQDAPWNAKEQKHGSLPVAPRDAPRYSYDEKESQDKLKSTTKLKELPRLSLDSRERSIRYSASQVRSNNLSREIYSESAISSQIINLNQEPGSNKRPSTIVARLMGLEPIPDFIPTDNDQMIKMVSCLDEDSDTISRSSRVCDESKQKQVSGFPRISCKIPASPQLRNENSVMKSTSSSKFPQDSAPWRQTDGNRSCQKQEFKYQESSTNSPHASPSVYGEIEKRLTELEFKKSDKDLRALKQILEAMEKTNARLGNKKDEQILNSESNTSKCSPDNSFDRASTQQIQSNYPASPFIKGSSSPRRYGSQIVVMKTAKLYEKPANPPDCKPSLQKKWSGYNADNIKDLVGRRTVKNITPRKNHLTNTSSWPQTSIDKKKNSETQRSSQHSKVPQHMGGENPASFRRSSGTLSPRLQQKTHRTEKQSCLTTQPSGMRRARNQSIKQSMESGTPTRKYKQKYTNLQQGNEQLSWLDSEARNLSHQGDTVSMQSDSGISLASHSDIDVTSTDNTKQITDPYQLKDPNEEVSFFFVQDFTARFIEDRLIAEFAIATLEQPSPVSVLDTTFYEEDCPSPVKMMSTAFQYYDTLNIDEAEWTADHLKNSRRSNPSSKFELGKLENIDNLVHKLQLMNSAQDEDSTNHIESPCDNTNPDHRYIAEILVAAGVDLGSRPTTIQLHPLELSVNPNLFHVLEIAMGSSEPVDKHHEKGARSITSENIRRKLVFDVVNEILVQKSALAGSSVPWIFQNKMGGRSMSVEKLLKELCSKLDHQQATTESNLDSEDDGLTSILSADMINEPENWGYYISELPGIMLDIERLIFKDLIGEVVSGGAAVLQVQPGRHCRKLFSK